MSSRKMGYQDAILIGGTLGLGQQAPMSQELVPVVDAGNYMTVSHIDSE